MENYQTISTLTRLVRGLLQDRLRSNGRDSYAYLGDINFTLSEDFISSSTIKVYKNGTLLSSGYSFNASTNIVTITTTLITSDTIVITYSYYDKWSDSEIVDYIESALTYFSQFGYKKIFRLNDDRTEVLTINGISPTVRECYEISIISAIHIDPNNIEIRTKDFTITAKENESKSELINRALNQFTSYLGEITFEEDILADIV